MLHRSGGWPRGRLRRCRPAPGRGARGQRFGPASVESSPRTRHWCQASVSTVWPGNTTGRRPRLSVDRLLLRLDTCATKLGEGHTTGTDRTGPTQDGRPCGTLAQDVLGTRLRRSRSHRGARRRQGRPTWDEPRRPSAQQGNVERAAAEVVDDHDLTRLASARSAEVDAPRLAGSVISPTSPSPTCCIARRQEVELELRPVRRMVMTTTHSGGSPNCSVTDVRRPTAANNATRRSAEYGAPDSMIGTGSPKRRLNSRATAVGFGRIRHDAAAELP